MSLPYLRCLWEALWEHLASSLYKLMTWPVNVWLRGIWRRVQPEASVRVQSRERKEKMEQGQPTGPGQEKRQRWGGVSERRRQRGDQEVKTKEEGLKRENSWNIRAIRGNKQGQETPELETFVLEEEERRVRHLGCSRDPGEHMCSGILIGTTNNHKWPFVTLAGDKGTGCFGREEPILPVLGECWLLDLTLPSFTETGCTTLSRCILSSVTPDVNAP